MGTRTGAVALTAILLASVPMLGQSRGTRGQTTNRNRPPASLPENPEPQTQELPAPVDIPPATIPSNGAGVVIPPNQGYVPKPESAPAGSVTEARIPEDPVDQTYWPLYDRERPITLTGKVTRVDWTTPNTYIFIATDTGPWVIESSFAQYRQARVSPAVRVDELITVMGYLPKTSISDIPVRRFATAATYLRANHLIRAGELTTVFGQKLTFGKPPTDAELAERFTCPFLEC